MMNISASLPTLASFPATSFGNRHAASSDEDEALRQSDESGGREARSVEEERQLEALKARDREVRDHEHAHLAAAAGLALSGARFEFERGPDGQSYAVGGEVRIDTSPGRTPEETIRRAQAIQAAALAPAEPSGQDRAVAAQAARMEAEARAELAAAGEEGGADEEAVPAPAALREEQLQRHYALAERTTPGQRVDIRA